MGRIVDSDLVIVRSAVRNGTIRVEMQWKDASGNDLGTYSASWPDTDSFVSFLNEQGWDDVLRAVMRQCVNRNTGQLRNAVFDGLAGKTFQVQTRVQQQ